MRFQAGEATETSPTAGFPDLFHLSHGGSARGIWWDPLGRVFLASQSGSTPDSAGYDEVGTRLCDMFIYASQLPTNVTCM